MAESPILPVPTIGEIARRNKSTNHKVAYAIERLKIQPVGRAGHYAIYSEDDAVLIGEFLARVEDSRVKREKQKETNGSPQTNPTSC